MEAKRTIYQKDFVIFLNRVLVCFSLDLCCMDAPMLVFAAWLVQEPYEGEFPSLFANLLRLSPNFSPNFFDFLRTFLRTKYILLRTIIAP